MALKPDRVIEMTLDAGSVILNDVAAKGSILCWSTTGSGSVLGDAHGVVQLAADASGLKVAGVLLQDFVNINETLFHRNFNKEEAVIGDFADVASRGHVMTNKYTGSPTNQAKAYLTANGVVTPTVSATGGTVATPFVGKFGGVPDEDGYVKLHFALPGEA